MVVRDQGEQFVIKTILIAASVMAGSATSAATIVYNVDQTIGLGTVTGTISTNGDLGVLDLSDITAFSLTVSGPGASVLLDQGNSIIAGSGTNFSATATSLSFNYGGAAGYLLFQLGQFGTGMKYYCNASVEGTCFQGASAIPESFNSPSAQVEARGDSQIIGTVGGTVPEPASWALMVGGFGLVGAALRRRSAARVVYA